MWGYTGGANILLGSSEYDRYGMIPVCSAHTIILLVENSPRVPSPINPTSTP